MTPAFPLALMELTDLAVAQLHAERQLPLPRRCGRHEFYPQPGGAGEPANAVLLPLDRRPDRMQARRLRRERNAEHPCNMSEGLDPPFKAARRPALLPGRDLRA
jgi:hypothetical protein